MIRLAISIAVLVADCVAIGIATKGAGCLAMGLLMLVAAVIIAAEGSEDPLGCIFGLAFLIIPIAGCICAFIVWPLGWAVAILVASILLVAS